MFTKIKTSYVRHIFANKKVHFGEIEMEEIVLNLVGRGRVPNSVP